MEEGTGLRTTLGHGLEKFLDRYKLVIENTGSGNINDIEPMADEICKIASDLEVVLLTQFIDYTNTDWTIYYKPAGATEPAEREGQLYKENTLMADILFDRIEWGDEDAMSKLCELITDREDLKKFTEDYGDSWEDMEEFLALLEGKEADIFCDQFDTLKAYFEDGSAKAPYIASGKGVPPIEYLARLFKGKWGLDFRPCLKNV